MKAFVFSEKGSIEKKEIDRPSCDEKSVVLTPLYLTICSSDVHTIFSNSIPRRKDMVLGHEGIAKVVEVGKNVKNFDVGDIVIVPACMPENGSSGHGTSPFSGNVLGRNINGMWAEYFMVPNADNNLVLLPKDIKIENAILLGDMLATAYTGVKKIISNNKSCSVLIFGSGAVGLLTVALIRIFFKYKKIIMVGSNNEINISLAKEFGINTYISYKDNKVCFGEKEIFNNEKYNRIHDDRENSKKTPLVDKIFEYTNNAGFEEIIIAGGNADTVSIACDVAKYGTGKIINLSYIEGTELSLPLFSLGKGLAGKTLYFDLCEGGIEFLNELLDIVRDFQKKGVMIDKLFTQKLVGFDEIPTALKMMKERKDGTIKVLVDLHEDK